MGHGRATSPDGEDGGGAAGAAHDGRAQAAGSSTAGADSAAERGRLGVAPTGDTEEAPPPFETWMYCGQFGPVRVSEFACLRPISPRENSGRDAYARPANKRDLGHKCVFCRRPFSSLGMEIVTELVGGPTQRFHRACWRRCQDGERPPPLSGPPPGPQPATPPRSTSGAGAALGFPELPRPSALPKAIALSGGRAAAGRHSELQQTAAFGSGGGGIGSAGPAAGHGGRHGIALCSASAESCDSPGNVVAAYVAEWRKSSEHSCRRSSIRRARSEPHPSVLYGLISVEDGRGHKKISQGYSQAEVEALKKRWAVAEELDGEADVDTSNGGECAICFRDWGEPLAEPLALPCGHVFCSACVEPWLRRCAVCPMCRRDLRASPRGCVAEGASSPPPVMASEPADAQSSPAGPARPRQRPSSAGHCCSTTSRGARLPASLRTLTPSASGLCRPASAPRRAASASASQSRQAPLPCRPASAPRRPPSPAPCRQRPSAPAACPQRPPTPRGPPQLVRRQASAALQTAVALVPLDRVAALGTALAPVERPLPPPMPRRSKSTLSGPTASRPKATVAC